MSALIDKIEERIKLYEEELVKLVNNHTAITGALNELRHVLTIANDVAVVLKPPAVPIISVAEEVVDAMLPDPQQNQA